VVANRGPGRRAYSGSSSFGDAVRYITRESELRPGQEPALATWSENVVSIEVAPVQMQRLAAQSRVEEPLYHLYASWAPGEKPTYAQAREALDVYIDKLGFAGLQYVAALQNDGTERLYHIHAVFNLVDPETKTARSVWRDHTKMREASRVIEFAGGWKNAERPSKARAVSRAESLVVGARLLADPQPLLAQLTAHDATFTRVQAMAAIAAKVEDLEQRQELLAKLLSPPVSVELADKRTGAERFTTQAVLDAERELQRAVVGMKTGANAIRREAPPRLDEQQRAAFDYILAGGSRLKIVTGVPGSGKTTLINAIAEAYTAAGYTVRAVSIANSAVDVLRRETTVPARSVAKELWEWGQGRERLGKRDLLVIDEVSTLGTDQGAALLREANERGAIVVALGDAKQFQAVAHGSALTIMQAVEAGIDMAKTRRQVVDWQRAATEAVRAGEIAEGIGAYATAGFVHRTQTQDEARKALVERWTDYERDGIECGIETFTNKERVAVNALARAAWRGLGRLTGEDVRLDTIDGLTPYAPGDRIVVRESIPEAALFNGSVATVQAIDGATLHVRRRDGQTVAIDTRQFPGVQHGYCSTEYREQGATRYAELQLVTEHVSQRSLTVGMTRHTHGFEMFYSAEAVGTFEDLVVLGQRTRSKELASTFAVVDRAKLAREAQERTRAAAQKNTREIIGEFILRVATVKRGNDGEDYTVAPGRQSLGVEVSPEGKLLRAAIVYDLRRKADDTGKSVYLTEFIELSELARAYRHGNVKIHEQHQAMFEAAIARVRVQTHEPPQTVEVDDAKRLREMLAAQKRDNAPKQSRGRGR
jgi:hypothetical protein